MQIQKLLVFLLTPLFYPCMALKMVDHNEAELDLLRNKRKPVVKDLPARVPPTNPKVAQFWKRELKLRQASAQNSSEESRQATKKERNPEEDNQDEEEHHKLNGIKITNNVYNTINGDDGIADRADSEAAKDVDMYPLGPGAAGTTARGYARECDIRDLEDDEGCCTDLSGYWGEITRQPPEDSGNVRTIQNAPENNPNCGQGTTDGLELNADESNAQTPCYDYGSMGLNGLKWGWMVCDLRTKVVHFNNSVWMGATPQIALKQPGTQLYENAQGNVSEIAEHSEMAGRLSAASVEYDIDDNRILDPDCCHVYRIFTIPLSIAARLWTGEHTELCNHEPVYDSSGSRMPTLRRAIFGDLRWPKLEDYRLQWSGPEDGSGQCRVCVQEICPVPGWTRMSYALEMPDLLKLSQIKVLALYPGECCRQPGSTTMLYSPFCALCVDNATVPGDLLPGYDNASQTCEYYKMGTHICTYKPVISTTTTTTSYNYVATCCASEALLAEAARGYLNIETGANLDPSFFSSVIGMTRLLPIKCSFCQFGYRTSTYCFNTGQPDQICNTVWECDFVETLDSTLGRSLGCRPSNLPQVPSGSYELKWFRYGLPTWPWYSVDTTCGELGTPPQAHKDIVEFGNADYLTDRWADLGVTHAMLSDTNPANIGNWKIILRLYTCYRLRCLSRRSGKCPPRHKFFHLTKHPTNGGLLVNWFLASGCMRETRQKTMLEMGYDPGAAVSRVDPNQILAFTNQTTGQPVWSTWMRDRDYSACDAPFCNPADMTVGGVACPGNGANSQSTWQCYEDDNLPYEYTPYHIRRMNDVDSKWINKGNCTQVRTGSSEVRDHLWPLSQNSNATHPALQLTTLPSIAAQGYSTGRQYERFYPLSNNCCTFRAANMDQPDGPFRFCNHCPGGAHADPQCRNLGLGSHRCNADVQSAMNAAVQ